MYKDIPENNEIEFKEKLSPDTLSFVKTAVAFANGAGGKVVFGVRDFDQVILEDSVSEKDVKSLCENLYKNALEFSVSDEAKNILKPIAKSQLVSWKIISKENKKLFPSNAFWLLKGNTELFPDSKIRCAVFKGKERGLFITRQDIDGPLYEQVQKAYEFVLEHIYEYY